MDPSMFTRSNNNSATGHAITRPEIFGTVYVQGMTVRATK